MAGGLNCKIVTPAKTVFASSAVYVALPGELGSFGVMQNHESLVSNLMPGTVTVTAPDDGKGKESKTSFLVSGGYAQIDNNMVIVLADDAVEIASIDADAVGAELAKVEQSIAGFAPGDAGVAYYKAQRDWLGLQLKAVKSAQ